MKNERSVRLVYLSRVTLCHENSDLPLLAHWRFHLHACISLVFIVTGTTEEEQKNSSIPAFTQEQSHHEKE
jgi:hypothetical protein